MNKQHSSDVDHSEVWTRWR